MIPTRQFPVLLLFAVSATASACASRLPASAEPLLLRRLHAQKIIEIRDLRRRSIAEFDYLGFSGNFEINWGFESWYHPLVVLRKRRSDSDWSAADLFSSRPRIPELFQLPDSEFTKALIPWPPEKP